MNFQTLTGSLKRLPKTRKYLIQWDGKSRSKMQFKAKQFLKKYWKDHVVFEEFPLVGTRMTFDFYNANKKVMVEVQGAQHTKFTPFFHNKRGDFVAQIRKDQQKLDFCKLNKIKLIEIYPEDSLTKQLFADQGVHL
jgi:hypothetical protein